MDAFDADRAEALDKDCFFAIDAALARADAAEADAAERAEDRDAGESSFVDEEMGAEGAEEEEEELGVDEWLELLSLLELIELPWRLWDELSSG